MGNFDEIRTTKLTSLEYRTMSFSPNSKTYLYKFIFEDRDELKRLGAKWDATSCRWYVGAELPLEPFNMWRPNLLKYIACSYNEKEDAKRAGCKWDSSCHQLWFNPYFPPPEAELARWLPSLQTNAAKAKPAVLTQSQIALLPKVNSDMTIAQLQTECRARDPSVRIFRKSKSWLLEHLKIGTPWISSVLENYVGEESGHPPSAANKIAMEQDEHKNRYNEDFRFSPDIRFVQRRHLVPESPDMPYTVWCSVEYRRHDAPGDWLDANTPAVKRFDSVWATKSEANSRAKYLFAWKNPWELPAEKIFEDFLKEVWTVDGLRKELFCSSLLTLYHPIKWAVGVAHPAEFPYLDYATYERHDRDEDEIN